MNKAKILKIFNCFETAAPEPTTELLFKSPFELLIAVILSAQATDKSVNKACIALFQDAKTPEQIVNLGENKLQTYIKTIGLYKTKAKNIMKACQRLVEKFNSKVPENRVDLESLPGVGRKTANVILNTFYKNPVIAVDTHVFRVSQRIGLAIGKTPLDIEMQLMKVIPPRYLQNAHHWLILHGRYTCVARTPKCPECIIRKWCEYPDKTV